MKLNSRKALFLAVLLSVLLHLLSYTATQLSFPDFFTNADEVLSKKKASGVTKVSVRIKAAPPPAKPAPKPGVASVSIGAPPQGKPAKKSKTQPKAAEVAAPPEPAPDAATPAASPEEPAIPEAPAEANPPAPEPPKVEPAPSFPVESRAVYRARFMGLSADFRQTWHMEGFRYSVDYEGKKFGFTARMNSEGQITPEGLRPEIFRSWVNDKLRHTAQFGGSGNTLVYGKPGDPKQIAQQADAQDMASLPFHMAVSFAGNAERQLQVTSGNSVYEIVMKLESEENLKLPAGTLRTLHLTGIRRHQDGQEQAGYDVWIAPDYLNFPVKFRGPDSKGNILEFSIKDLEFEGKRVLGKDIEDEANGAEPQQLPKEFLERHQLESPPAPPSQTAP